MKAHSDILTQAQRRSRRRSSSTHADRTRLYACVYAYAVAWATRPTALPSVPQVYALVSREKTVLAEYTASSGNFPTVTRVLLAKIPSHDGRMSYVYDKCVTVW